MIDFDKPVRLKRPKPDSILTILGHSQRFLLGVIMVHGLPSAFMWTEAGEAWQAGTRRPTYDIENTPAMKKVVIFTEIGMKTPEPGEYFINKNGTTDWFEKASHQYIGMRKCFHREDGEVEEQNGIPKDRYPF